MNNNPSRLNLILEGLIAWIFHRPRTFIGVLAGFLGGICFHWLGFWDTLILIGCVVIGLLVGRYLDDRHAVGEVLDRLFTQDH